MESQIPAAAQSDWAAAGDRIDALVTASAAGGAVARERAEELVRLVVDLYGAGLERLLELLHERDALGDDVLEALAADGLVSSLLLVHGLHPESASTRVANALAAVAPGGEATLIEITRDGIARVRMTASGCSSGALKASVESAIADAAPEVVTIEMVEPERSAGTVIPVDSLFSRVGPAAS
ncbi:NifU family protein [Asanoa ferruginea]|uniref:NifU family protein n=1 Tax=Asanoa ferruginea TaxID=53367 RepID=UPI000E25D306|nr:NifU family protein [Asanoa ferruginea]